MANSTSGLLTNGVTITQVLADAGAAADERYGASLDLDGDGVYSNSDEFVQITNFSTVAVDISGWQIWASTNGSGAQGGVYHTFPPGTFLQPGESLNVITEYAGTPPEGVVEANGVGAATNTTNGLFDGLNGEIALVNTTNPASVEYVQFTMDSSPDDVTKYPGFPANATRVMGDPLPADATDVVQGYIMGAQRTYGINNEALPGQTVSYNPLSGEVGYINGAADFPGTSTDQAGIDLNGVTFDEVLPDNNEGYNRFDVDGDGTATGADQFVSFVNTTKTDIDISGYEVWSTTQAGTDTTVYLYHRFAPGTVLQPGETIYIVTEYSGDLSARSENIVEANGAATTNTSQLLRANADGEIALVDPKSGNYIQFTFDQTPANLSTQATFPGNTNLGTITAVGSYEGGNQPTNSDTYRYDHETGIVTEVPQTVTLAYAGGTRDGVINGTAGADQIGPGYIDDQGDALDGADGLNDVIAGGGGNDAIDGGYGDDWVDGGIGNDTLTGGAGNDTVTGDDGADIIAGGDGADALNGGAGDDDIAFGGADSAVGGTGDDVFTLDATDTATNIAATIDGGSDATDGNPDDAANGNAGDILDLSAQTTALDVVIGADGESGTLNGLDADAGTDIAFTEIEAIALGAGTDTLDASAATAGVNVDAGAGDDSLRGGSGDDSLRGGEGSDTLVGGAGADTLNGGTGQDLADYSASTAGVNVDLMAGTGTGGDAEGDTLIGIDHVTGSNFNDTLSGYNGNVTEGTETFANLLDGGAGDDLIDGRGGDDTLLGGAGNDTLIGGEGADVLTGGAGADLFQVAGADTVTDFDVTGGVGDDDPTNNDVVDLSTYYNEATLAKWNAANPTQTYASPLAWLRADQADGVLDAAGGAELYSPDGQPVAATDLSTENTLVICFASGTQILTRSGEVAIERLTPGAHILTLDKGFQPIRWIGSRTLSAEELAAQPNLRPIRICAGALGHNQPERDLVVSPQHRVLVRSKVAERMFGKAEVLVAAKHLLAVQGIAVAEDMTEVTYWHFLFDAHQVVFANGAASESLFTGPQALKAVSPAAREEILAIFPDLANVSAERPAPARHLGNGREGRKLAARVAGNGKALVGAVSREAEHDLWCA